MYVFHLDWMQIQQNTHHQALRECRAKGSGELKVEAKQRGSLTLFSGKERFISTIWTMLVIYVNGANKCFHHAENSSASERLTESHHAQCHIHHRHDSSSSTLDRDVISASASWWLTALSAEHWSPAPITMTPNTRDPLVIFLLHCWPSDYSYPPVSWT